MSEVNREKLAWLTWWKFNGSDGFANWNNVSDDEKEKWREATQYALEHSQTHLDAAIAAAPNALIAAKMAREDDPVVGTSIDWTASDPEPTDADREIVRIIERMVSDDSFIAWKIPDDQRAHVVSDIRRALASAVERGGESK